ncbi:6-phosphogluconolactonase [Sphingomonas guangdongensis]|uniref:6-phosphogluconolactonase n=1 Tax=Sphingomonas guangdongensis TaxID=1141890 RepID=A0A285QY75_9SPHN|nr:beta-propeller fold lactonase family protein [Sphingomonas guangdongensis]SOB86925.1 6-phosphogluconolactonase [Sphingomonas guangdongensis]
MIRLIAGGYEEAGAAGLYPLVLEAGSLRVEPPVAGINNVSGGLRVPGTNRWYVVEERAGRVLLIDGDGGWQVIAAGESGGDGPCHLALAPDGRALAAANYDSGDVAVLTIGEDGLPSRSSAHRAVGSGLDAERQGGPHAHWVGYGRDGRLYATDLGVDRVLAFADAHMAEASVAFAAPAGSGPRQIAFHPVLPRAYLVSELASTLTVLDCSAEQWRAVATLSTLPAGIRTESLGGAMAIDAVGTRLYVTNRGHDSVATFALDRRGDAAVHGHVSSGGRSPRYLLLCGDQLLVAHEQAGGVTLLPIGADGLPQTVIARADVPGAAFLGVVD